MSTPNADSVPTNEPTTVCSHPGGYRAEDGGWECSRCGHLFASYEAWGAETGNEAAVAAVKAAIHGDLAQMRETP
jgi:ribosomal protein L37AE/L43A